MRLSLVACLPLVSAFWRLPCAKPITIERTDPIVVYGAVAGHIHTVMGASGFSATASGDSIRSSKCSTCEVNEDMSNYWIQTLFYQHRNGSMESVKQNGGMLVYYLQRKANDNEVLTPMPPQLRMLAGTPSRNYFDGSLEARAVSYNCLNYAGGGGPETHAFPQKNCPNNLRVQVFFPSCWDGVNSDSSDHKRHMAYPSNVDSGTCPTTHPKRIVSIFFEVFYDVDVYKNDWLDANGKPSRAMPFFWSTGDNTGFGHHGDFMNGWDNTVLQRAVETCTDDSGDVRKCAAFTFRTDADTCLPEFKPSSNENFTGTFAAIPGLSAIPVSRFDPCGVSPTVGLDQTQPGVPIGACTAAFRNASAYTVSSPVADNLVTGRTAIVERNPNPISQEGYLGCWKDDSNTMEKKFDGGATYTPATCRAKVKAATEAYVVFAVQYGGECFASTVDTRYKMYGASTECTQTCNSDKLLYCGSGRVNQVYSVNSLAVPPTPARAPTSAPASLAPTQRTSPTTKAPTVPGSPTLKPTTSAPNASPTTSAPGASPSNNDPMVTGNVSSASLATVQVACLLGTLALLF